MPRLFLKVLSEAKPLPAEEGVALEDRFEVAVEWLIKEDDGAVRANGLTDYRGLMDLADPNVEWLADPDNTVVVLPSQFVLMIQCDVPGRSAAQIRRALPFAAEEYVASDIELMHIAHGPIKPAQAVLCNIVAHEVMENWLACFNSVGVTPGYFIADSQLLTDDDNTVGVLFDGSVALVASANQAATVDRDNLTLALSSLLNGLDHPRLLAINGELTDLERGQLDVECIIEQVQTSEYGTLDYLADRFAELTPINLLQDRYTPVRPNNPKLKRWNSIAALAAGWAVIAFVGLVVQGFWASSEADRLEQASFDKYKAMFPTESQPVTLQQLRRTLSAKLGVKSDATDAAKFVDLTAHFANAVKPTNQVVSINYADQREEVTVEVMLDSYDDLEVIKSKLAAADVAVDVANAEEEGDKVRSRLRVRYQS